jgi:hypothetical protein
MVTSKADREHKILGLELGADDYIQKPFHARELLARVRSLVRLHELRRALAERNVVLERTNAELTKALEELRHAEAQIIAQERFAAVGELAAGIAHEINNPVNFACNAVRALQTHVKDVQRVAQKITQLDPDMPSSELTRLAGELHLLQQELAFEDLTESFDELARIASEGLSRTSRLVGDLREFASPRPVAQKLVDLPLVIESTVLLVSHIARESGIEIDRRVNDDVEPIPGNAGAISQVVLNVLKNAIDSFEGSPGRIELTLTDAANEVAIDVSDDGPGIDPEIREHLFEPFFSTKNSRGNSGLGLSIVKSIVEQHGGEIQVVPRSPRGTCFRITLPR